MQELAKIVRAADTGKFEPASEAAGLDAAVTGIAVTSKNDSEAVERAAQIYDAFYDYCRLKILQEKYRDEIKGLDKKQQREFLRKKLGEQPQKPFQHKMSPATM